MSVLECILLGLALGADSFTVAVGLGMSTRMGWRRALAIALMFGGTAALLAASGYGIAFVVHWVLLMSERLDWFHVGALETRELVQQIHWALTLLGAALLAGLGLNLLSEYRGRSPNGGRAYRGRFALVMLALGVSIDAATAGASLGMLDTVDLGLTVTTIGGCSWLLTGAGLGAGRRLGRVAGRRAQLVGGLLLIALAAHFASHVL